MQSGNRDRNLLTIFCPLLVLAISLGGKPLRPKDGADQSAASRPACTVTIPNGGGPPGRNSNTNPKYKSHGNGKLSTILPSDGKVVIVPTNGLLWWKIGWWRASPGFLTIEGHRLDAPAVSVHSHIPTGYGNLGFQASGILFPSEGCWEITGLLAGSKLSFVVDVRKEALKHIK
jgi:hypothetical protein